MDYLDILYSPIVADVWVSYMQRPTIVFPVVLAVAVFVLAFTGISGVAETVVRKRGEEAWKVYAPKAMVVAVAVSLCLAAAAVYAAPV